MFFDVYFGALRRRFGLLDSRWRLSSVLPDIAQHAVSNVGYADLECGARGADGAHEELYLILLPCKDVLDCRAQFGATGIGF